jgi:hypothetical protein
MKPEKQRIAIAEACGWTRQSDDSMWFNDPTNSFQAHEQDVPDYLNNLNAIHKAEKVMGYDDRLNYPAQLFDVVCRTSGEWQKVFNKIHPDAWALQATASQRAEAFLKTIGKWEEEA